jgi:Uma2 family endonuclease
MTVDEFIAWDNARGRKHPKYELVDGEARAMAPASNTHGIIQANLAREIGVHLNAPGSKCKVLTEPAVETRISASRNMRIPDLAVNCSPDVAGEIALADPILLIEITSPGNKKDTWSNVWAYTTIPSVKEIVIVESTRIEALLLRRQADGSWPADPEMIGADATLTLTSIDMGLPLVSIYRKTHLAP